MMKKGVFLFLVMCMAVLSLEAGEGYTTVNRFKGKRISRLDVSGIWEIQLSQGKQTGVKLTFPERFKKQLEVSLDGEKLNIGFHGEVHLKSGEKLKAVVVCSSLQKIELSGACRLEGKRRFSGREMQFELTGAAKVQMNDEVIVSGKLKTDLSGVSCLSCKKISAQQFDMELSGTSKIELSGKARQGKIEASGVSKCDLSDFQVVKVEVDISGVTNVQLNVSELITGEVSGASKVKYTGAASTQVDVSGTAGLKHL